MCLLSKDLGENGLRPKAQGVSRGCREIAVMKEPMAMKGGVQTLRKASINRP